jgi:hypothetical protein
MFHEKHFGPMDGLRKSIFARRGRCETGILRELTYAVGFNFWPCVFSNGVSPFDIRAAGVVHYAPSAAVTQG